MIFKLSSFSTLALTLFSLDAVTGLQIARRSDLHVSGRNNVNIRYFDQNAPAFGGECGIVQPNNDGAPFVLLGAQDFSIAVCNNMATVSTSSGTASGPVLGICPPAVCPDGTTIMVPATFFPSAESQPKTGDYTLSNGNGH